MQQYNHASTEGEFLGQNVRYGHSTIIEATSLAFEERSEGGRVHCNWTRENAHFETASPPPTALVTQREICVPTRPTEISRQPQPDPPMAYRPGLQAYRQASVVAVWRPQAFSALVAKSSYREEKEELEERGNT